MPEPDFPKPVAEVVTILADIFRHQRRPEVVEILENAHAHFDNTEYDNWNGGTYTWVLRLEVPVPIFASVEAHLAKFEKEIGDKLTYFSREYPNDHLGQATIAPILSSSPLLGQRIAPSEVEVRRLWPEGCFRLFISHVSKHKAAVSKLKDELQSFGISAFVAHEAIQPSLEWQKEIELALRSMHALAALITPDFHESSWTDQETGWAFGRGTLVLPVRLGVDPYGFAGKVQAISGNLGNPEAWAKFIFDTLLLNSQTHGEMRRALVTAFCNSGSYIQSIMLRDLVAEIADFSDSEKQMMIDACEQNDQLANAYKVSETINKKFGKPKESAKADGVPF